MGAAAIGLDFSAVLMMGAAQQADLELLSEVLPEYESIVIVAMSGEPSGTSDEEFS
jgi:hypothetical protein